jgi:Domain of Unknown Function (DUF349)
MQRQPAAAITQSEDGMGLLDRLRPQPAWTHKDTRVRREAIRQIDDAALLDEIRRTDPDERVRQDAGDALLELALEAGDETVAREAARHLDDPRHLLAVARSGVHEAVARVALELLADARALGSVARNAEHGTLRLLALERLQEPAEIAAVALKSPHADVAEAAALRIGDADAETLHRLATRARCHAAARIARGRLRQREEAADGAAARPVTDRRPQIALCEAVEALARSPECDRLAADLSAAKDAWTDLIPEVDEDLEERFAAACRAARERLARNQVERAKRQATERERARHITPRQALCEAAEAAQGEEIPARLDEILLEWARLEPCDSDEAAALQERFGTACDEARLRHERWRQQTEEERRAAAAAAEKEERGRLERANAERLKALCDRLRRLIGTENPAFKKVEGAWREAHAALDAMPPLPSRRERERLARKLKALLSDLAPRFKELRESEEWKRWANAGVQEDLCAQAEALREVGDPVEAGRRLRDLQALWKTASAAPREKSRDLWERFKKAGDEVHARLVAHHAALAEARTALCVRVEALADSTDWAATGAAIKGLQAEWKALGPIVRGRDRALFARFRKSCDRFFTGRDATLAARKEEWKRNLAAKEALCIRAEALVDSTDWDRTAAEAKTLQAEWKTIGPVGRRASEAIWTRFRGACDRFFERYKRRDRIEQETHLAAREAICAEVEALLPADSVTDAPPAEALAAALQELRRRWQQAGAPPPDRVADLNRRFNAALGRIVEALPESVKGTDLDPEGNRRRLEDLCARVEKQLPGAGSPQGETASPAARLAAQWVEAMAANTIGGRDAQEAKWKAAAEEVKRAQAAWQRVGYVPEAIRVPLAERFETACRRVFEGHGASGSGGHGARGAGRSGARTGSGRAESGRAGSGRAGSGRAGSGRAG